MTPPPAATRRRLYAMLPASRFGIIKRFASVFRPEIRKHAIENPFGERGIAMHLALDREVRRARLNERERVAHLA